MNRNTKNVFFGLITFFLSVFVGHHVFAQPSKQKTPNIVLILADDLGFEALGCNGSLDYQTPNLDELAANALRFEHCYATPLCTPSRVKLMTGQYNYRNYEHFGYLNPNQKTFGNILKNAGYATCIAGKWQLNGLNHNDPKKDDLMRPNHFGFDEYCLWQLQVPSSPNAERYANPLIVQNGKNLPRDKNNYGPQVFSNFVQDFIDRKANKPFFVYYPMVLTHDPFVPTPLSRTWSDSTKRYEKKKIYFADMVSYMDNIVGQIITKLKEKGVWENTLLIFTADNGTNINISSATQYGKVKGGKGSSLNTGNHVPLIVSWPKKIKRGRVVKSLVDFTDFVPTLAEAVVAERSSYFTDGKSFMDIVNGKKERTNKSEIFIHYAPQFGGFASNRWVMNDSYKLYQDGRFYNTTTDPEETKNIINPNKKELIIKDNFSKIIQQKEKESPFSAKK